jgi:ATP-dependent Lhr-like helicase
VASGRWTTFRAGARDTAAAAAVGAPGDTDAPPADFAARRLLARTGVVFRRTIERERLPVPWRELLRALRALEVRGEVRGGRCVAGVPGEQYALPEAVVHLRAVRTDARTAGEGAGERAVECVTATEPVSVLAADPLNFAGILTPDERVAATARRQVTVA